MTRSRWHGVLRDLITEFNISERELARLSGVARTTIRRTLSADMSMKIDDLELCLAVFGLELDAHPIPIEEAS